MQVIYVIPFVLISVFAFSVCVIVPRWRRYKLQALVAPIAFGFCSIVAAAVMVLTSDHFNLGLFSRTWTGPQDAVPLLLIYVVPGLIGSWAAVLAVTKIAHRSNG